MDIKLIKKLTEIFDEKELTYLSIEEDGLKVCMKKEISSTCAPGSSAIERPVYTTEPSAMKSTHESGGFEGYREIVSPIAGVFYSAPSPDAEPFVQIGDRVLPGDVLCVIEAMKLMNELNADIEGEIVDICAENEAIVEYGQVLFRIK